MAQTPKITFFGAIAYLLSLDGSIVEVRSEYELVDEGDEDRVRIELDRYVLSGEFKKDDLRV